MLTRRQPAAIAAASESSSRMPPLISTSMSRVPTIFASSSRFSPRPKAASRSTRWIHSAPASCQRRAASTGSPNRFSEPATPCTSWTAWPSAMSTAGSSSRWSTHQALRVSASEHHRVQDGGDQQADDQRPSPAPPSRRRTPRPARSARAAARPSRRAAGGGARPARRSGASAARGASEVRARLRAAPRSRSLGLGCAGRRDDRRPPARAASRRRARSLLMPRPTLEHAHQPDPVAQQPRAGVAGLLGVELGGAQRAVLHRRDEPVAAVLGPGHQRRPGAVVGRPASSRARRRSARSRTARPRRRRTASCRPAPRRCSTPCGVRRAPAAARPRPGHSSQPSVSTPCSTPRSNRICMPTQMPSTGRPPASRRPMISCAAVTARRPGHARGERPDPGHDQAVGLHAPAEWSAVSVTSAPARSRARTAERRLPDP